MTEPSEWSNARRWVHRLLYVWAAAAIVVIALCFLTTPSTPKADPGPRAPQVPASSEFCSHARRVGELLHDNSARFGAIATAAEELVNELRSGGLRSGQAEYAAAFFGSLATRAETAELADGHAWLKATRECTRA